MKPVAATTASNRSSFPFANTAPAAVRRVSSPRTSIRRALSWARKPTSITAGRRALKRAPLGRPDPVPAQVAGAHPPQDRRQSVDGPRRERREGDPEKLNRNTQDLAPDHRRGRANRHRDPTCALLDQVGCELGAGVPEPDDEHAAAGERAPGAVLDRVDELAAKLCPCRATLE